MEFKYIDRYGCDDQKVMLRPLDNADIIRVISMKRGEALQIGRASKNPVKGPENLEAQSDNGRFFCKVMSRNHALLEATSGLPGPLYITDDSRYGTYLNNKKIKSKTPTMLHNGDILQFGDYVSQPVGNKLCEAPMVVKVIFTEVDTQNFIRPVQAAPSSATLLTAVPTSSAVFQKTRASNMFCAPMEEEDFSQSSEIDDEHDEGQHTRVGDSQEPASDDPTATPNLQPQSSQTQQESTSVSPVDVSALNMMLEKQGFQALEGPVDVLQNPADLDAVNVQTSKVIDFGFGQPTEPLAPKSSDQNATKAVEIPRAATEAGKVLLCAAVDSADSNMTDSNIAADLTANTSTTPIEDVASGRIASALNRTRVLRPFRASRLSFRPNLVDPQFATHGQKRKASEISTSSIAVVTNGSSANGTCAAALPALSSTRTSGLKQAPRAAVPSVPRQAVVWEESPRPVKRLCSIMPGLPSTSTLLGFAAGSVATIGFLASPFAERLAGF